MKYLRKMVVLIFGIVFVAALVICVGRIFAVKNVNVNLITYENDCTESYAQIKDTLKKYKGSSLLFLSEDDIAKSVSGSNYVVTSCEKKFPCTINVTLKERLEVFAVSVGGIYSMYDNDGIYLRSAENNENDIDGAENVLLTGIAVEQLPSIAGIAMSFKDTFGGLRSIVTSINIDSRPNIEGYSDKLIFNMRCGLIIQIDDYKDNSFEKITASYKKFCLLSDRQKMSGTIRGYRMGDEIGIINADYSALK